MEAQVAQDGAARQERTAHAREQVPVRAVSRTVGLRYMIGLFDQLTVDLVSKRLQVVTGLQDALDDGHRVRDDLHLLQRVENLHRLVLEAAVALPLLH